ncbi:hypothetical protein J6590_084809 [Homalodisca vitripennis]|nr:hypothetical protein J6590_084809 [Homalodisca vitripennis]
MSKGVCKLQKGSKNKWCRRDQEFCRMRVPSRRAQPPHKSCDKKRQYPVNRVFSPADCFFNQMTLLNVLSRGGFHHVDVVCRGDWLWGIYSQSYSNQCCLATFGFNLTSLVLQVLSCGTEN